MTFRQKYDRIITGVISGLVFPLIAAFVFYLSTSNGLSLSGFYMKVIFSGNLTRVMSIAVFTNIIIFLVFNNLDMLNASKGVLGVTILWAIVVFAVKLF